MGQKSFLYSIPDHLGALHRSPWTWKSFGQCQLQGNKMYSQRMGDDEPRGSGSRKRPSFDFIDPGSIPQPEIMKKYGSTFPAARKILHNYHGHSGFRGEQERVIARLQDKGSTLYMMPTGGGKSLIYQILARTIKGGGIILVLAPLISLIRVCVYIR